ncbi:hypothetical protein PHMEG_00015344 [Phytophthora megakarya]|uniref:Uncharacterized protein n=1 Tax=Phytophthora megakarya TaxID=4795 RepID=A0A225W341_9STRA|nr:hypothetical protein PHMEG_00015344 [Phytophthora megakarya]
MERRSHELLLPASSVGVPQDWINAALLLLEMSSSTMYMADQQHISSNVVTIELKGSQSDQQGRGAWRTMHASVLKHIIHARTELGDDNAYLCGDTNSADVASMLKATASSVEVPMTNYSTHFIRIGGGTALLIGDVSQLQSSWDVGCRAASSNTQHKLQRQHIHCRDGCYQADNNQPFHKRRSHIFMGPLTTPFIAGVGMK